MDCKEAAAVAAMLAIVLFGCCICLPVEDRAPSISGEATGTGPGSGDLIVSFTTDDTISRTSWHLVHSKS